MLNTDAFKHDSVYKAINIEANLLVTYLLPKVRYH